MRNDLDPIETWEWLDALYWVLAFDGVDRAYFLLDELINEARRSGASVPYSADTPYVVRRHATSPGAAVLPTVDDLRPVSATVAIGVARAVVDEWLAQVPLTDLIQRVHRAMWRPGYPTFEVMRAPEEV